MGWHRFGCAGFHVTPLGTRPAQSARVAATLVLIGAGLSALSWSISAGSAGAWPLAFVGLALLIAIGLDRSTVRRTSLDVPLLVFLATGIMGVWVAYDRGAAQEKLWMLLGAYVLFYALAIQPAQNLWAVATLLAVLGLGLAAYFLLTHDWQTYPPKFAIVQRLAQVWVAVRPAVNLPGLHPNVGGGLMSLLAPFQLAVAWGSASRRRYLHLLFFALALAFTALALLLTSSRGAMLGLAAGLVVWLLWRQALRRRETLARHRRLLWSLLCLAAGASFAALGSGWEWRIARLLDQLPGPASAMGRARIASQSLDLIADFPLTGGGLASFPGLYSRYVLGIPFNYLPNGHNIVLDVFLEQGLFGLLAFLLIVATTFSVLLQHNASHSASRAMARTTWVTGAALASFVVLLFHGMVEDTVYGSAALPVLLLSPGLAIALTRSAHNADASQTRRWDRRSAALLSVGALLVLVGGVHPHGRAYWWANAGAVSMARVELAGFPTGRWVAPKEDESLQGAANTFRKSLRHNPQQRTALYRMGLLAIASGDYTNAIQFLERARAVEPFHIGVRKALGYSYAWSGDLQRARPLLVSAPFVTQELDAYSTWWQEQGRPDLAQRAAQMRAYLQANDNEIVTE